jgi:hypothetical protein
MCKATYLAEISNNDGRIFVLVKSLDASVNVSRSFHNICDAERWLLRLSRTGLRKRDWPYLLEKQMPSFELPPIGPIRIVDCRVSKRMALPEVLS